MKDIQDLLETAWLGKEYLYLESVDSTNDFAYTRAEDGVKEGFVVAAGAQIDGRGRRGREWNSPYEDGLWFSLLLRPDMAPKDATGLTIVTAVGVARGLDHYPQLDVGIKWPNDLLIQGKKLCGILAEMKADAKKLHYVVIGVGINLQTKLLPASLQNVAIGMEDVLGEAIDTKALFCHILKGLESAYDEFYQGDFDAIKMEWAERSVIMGKRVTVETVKGTVAGTVIGVSKEGFLRLRTDENEVAQVISGDVTLEEAF